MCIRDSYTPNADFYRVDTALAVPQVPTEGWTLRVTGLVDKPLSLTFEDLLARNLVEEDITLTCVSNTCLLYTSDAADERSSVDLGGRRIIKKKKNKKI